MKIDIYIFSNDISIYNKFNKIQLIDNNIKTFNIQCYHSSPINGLLTENIFYRIFDKKYSCNMISKNIENPNKIFGIIIKPNINIINKSLESFIISNFHNKTYIKNIIGEDKFYNIFSHSQVTWGDIKSIFKKQLDKLGNNIFRIQENYNDLLNSQIPFPYIILDKNDIDNYISKFDYNNIKSYDNKIIKQPILNTNTNIIYYITTASIGMGDFLQRFERLYKLLNFSDEIFIPINNLKYSYNNPNHGSSKYLTMYDFPGFDFIEKKNNINDENIININFENLFELIMYDKNFFICFPKNYYLLINLGSFIINFNNRTLIKSIFNWTNNQKIIKEVSVPYSIYDWKFKQFSNNKLVVLHFRRGDYVDQILSKKSNPRTISTFNHTINTLIKHINEKEIDIVIISDHYNLNKITNIHKKYIPILFDYNQYSVNDIIKINGINIYIRDKVIGTNDTSNYNTLKYLSNSDYHVGNMSCLPHIISKIFNKNMKHFGVNPDIKNFNDLDNNYNKYNSYNNCI